MRTTAFLLILLSGQASACFVEPQHLQATPDALIDRTATIALAKVIRAQPAGHEVLYTLQTVRPIKGTPKRQFQLRGQRLQHPSERDDFDRHTRKTFWSQRTARLTMAPDCRVHPSFAVGATYLAFLDPPYHTKSFELIRVTTGPRQDAWLRHVQARSTP